MDITNAILTNFEQLSAVPRGTQREAKISRWLQDWAAAHKFAAKADSTGNLVLYVPGSKGREKEPAVVLQGHLDMVCEKTPDSSHNFETDPIRVLRDGDWLHADRTTLGADNGIALALCMTLALDDSVSHPPLELLFTVEEEIGIGGASGLDPALISGRIMINLDSEDEGSFIVGCAGGMTTFIDLPVSREPLSGDVELVRLTVGGLQGGHSGVDIHKFRANAIKILARLLDGMIAAAPLRLVSLKGGSARNAIPRDAQAVIACPAGSAGACRDLFEAAAAEIRAETSRTEPGLTLSLDPETAQETREVIDAAGTQTIGRLLVALPHGVIQMSADIEGFVETSTNLAMLGLADDGLHIVTNQRSSVNSKRDELNRRVEAMARLAGAQVNHTEGYLAWQPDMSSPLLGRAVRVYESLFGHKPEVRTIHAGLECGIIAARFTEPLDMLSLGPTIKNPHSPDERLHIPSVTKVWQFLVKLLESSL